MWSSNKFFLQKFKLFFGGKNSNKRLLEFNKRCKRTAVEFSDNFNHLFFSFYSTKFSEEFPRSGGNPVTFSSMALLHLITSGRLAEHIRNISQQLSHLETRKIWMWKQRRCERTKCTYENVAENNMLIVFWSRFPSSKIWILQPAKHTDPKRLHPTLYLYIGLWAVRTPSIEDGESIYTPPHLHF